MKHGYHMTCKGESYWGIPLMMDGKPTKQISRDLHKMRPKLKKRWATRNVGRYRPCKVVVV